jgi:putative membrane protein
MPHFIVTWLITALALWLTAAIVPGFYLQDSLAVAIAAVVVGLANATVRPILFILTFPITLLSLGLFSFLINAFTIWLVSTISPGFRIDGFLPALIGSIVLSVITGILNFFFNDED